MNAGHTTDPQDELFDVVDGDGNPTGISKPRGLIHRDGDWHRSLHIWVYGVDNDGMPFVLFQRRSRTKDTWPGALDVAVGGHIRAGENISETVREADEELGLEIELADLVRLGRRFHSWVGDGFIDRELNEVFALRSDKNLCHYRLHPEEIDSLVRISLDDCRHLFSDNRQVVHAVEYPPEPGEIKTGCKQIDVELPDFADLRDGYGVAAIESLSILFRERTPELFLIR